MRYLLKLLIIFILVVSVHAGESLIIPDGIRYKQAPVKINNEAKNVLNKLFSSKATDKEILSILENKSLICGPVLWRDIKNNNKLINIKNGAVTFNVPVLDKDGNIIRMDKHEGKLFQSPDEVLAFWEAFSKRTDFTELKIRKLNPEELKIFWAMIPFDITEPLFILESNKHKILTVFTSPEEKKIMWIDDYQNVNFKNNEDINKQDLGDGK